MLRYDGNLVAAGRIDETSGFDDSFRADKHEIDFVHDVCNCRIKDNRARYTGCSQRFVRFQTSEQGLAIECGGY